MLTLDRPRVRVSFSEMVAHDIVLLATEDHVTDSDGQRIELREGLRLYLYAPDCDAGGKPSFLVATGIAALNTANDWSAHVKWCCLIDEWGEVTSSS
jgi:hypothetical protein